MSGKPKTAADCTLIAPLPCWWKGGESMAELKIYRIREDYIAHLHSVDNKVQYNKGAKRPYVGIVLSVHDHDYFVPMESPKPSHARLKSSVHIIKIEGGKYGLLGFNNMVPAKKRHLVDFDIDAEANPSYKALLKNQLRFCRNNRDRITSRAAKTYEAAVVKAQPFYLGICCDFRLLEQESRRFF